MILTGNSLVNQRLNMTKHLSKTNGQPHPRSLRKRDANRPSARKRIFDTASELFYLKGIRAVGVETIAAEADTTKMSLYRNFPSKDELVAEWLREHDANFWKTWDTMASRHPKDPRRQIKAAFAVLAKHVADPKARGCPMANAAVELTEKDHPARKGKGVRCPGVVQLGARQTVRTAPAREETAGDKCGKRGVPGEHRSRNAGDRAAQETGPDHESTRHSEERPALAPAF